MKISANFKQGKESYYIPLSSTELQVTNYKGNKGELWYSSEELNEWLYAVFDCGGACEEGISIEIEHGKISACMYETAPCVDVLDNRPFPAKDAPQEEWDEYHAYCWSEEGRAHFIGYADPFNTPEEELRVEVEMELSLYEAYLLLRAAFPNITPQELLADVRALCLSGVVPYREEVALNEFLGWVKTAFPVWPPDCGGIPYRAHKAPGEGGPIASAIHLKVVPVRRARAPKNEILRR